MILKIKVCPKAKLNRIEKIARDEYRIWTTAAPDKGKANQAVVKMLAKETGVAKSGIEIIKGAKDKNKVVKLTNGE